MAIKIPFVAEVRDFLRGTSDVEEALEDVSDSLDDLVRDAQDAGQDAGKGLSKIEGGADDAETAVDSLADQLKKLDKAGDGAKNAAKDVDKVKHSVQDADEGVKTLKENAGSNLKEVGASFSDVNSAIGGLQGFISEAAEGFGAMGLAAGAAVAGGIGLLTTQLQAAADKANELTTNAGEFALQLKDTDAAGRVQLLADAWNEVATAIADSRQIFEVWQPRAVTNIEQFAKATESGAVSAQALMDAFTDPDPQRRVQLLNEQLAAANSLLNDMEAGTVRGPGSLGSAATDAAEGTNEYRSALVDTVSALKDKKAQEQASITITEKLAAAAGQTVEEYQDSQTALENLTVAQESASSTARAAAEAQQAYLDVLADISDPVDDYTEILERKNQAEEDSATKSGLSAAKTPEAWKKATEDTKVTMADLMADLDAQIARNKSFEANLATLGRKGMDEGLIASLRAKGPDVAGATVKTLAHAGAPAVQEYSKKQGDLLGKAAGLAVGTGIESKTDEMTLKTKRAVHTALAATADDLRANPASMPAVPVKADTAQFSRDLNTAASRGVRVPVIFVDRNGKPVT